MDSIETVKAYFNALDSTDMEQVDQYLSEDYQLVDFTSKPLDKDAMLDFNSLAKGCSPQPEALVEQYLPGRKRGESNGSTQRNQLGQFGSEDNGNWCGSPDTKIYHIPEWVL